VWASRRRLTDTEVVVTLEISLHGRRGLAQTVKIIVMQ
jgi:hypothetical protein